MLFSYGGDRCFSASEDGTIRAWTAIVDAPHSDVSEIDPRDLSDLSEEAKAAVLKAKRNSAEKHDAGCGAQCVGLKFNQCLGASPHYFPPSPPLFATTSPPSPSPLLSSSLSTRRLAASPDTFPPRLHQGL